MTTQDIELIGPTESLREETIAFLEEFRAAGESYGSDVLDIVRRDYAGFVRVLRRQEQGLDLPEGEVPTSTYALVRGGRMLGACTLSHTLNDSLRDYGGHIRYGVRPSERGKGYATAMLAMVLAEGRRRGLTRVLLTCDKENVGSGRVIRKNGGVLESEELSPQRKKVVQRYWIDL